MHSYQQIRSYMKSWAGLSYQEGIDQCFEVRADECWYQASSSCLRRLGLSEKKMDGRSFNGIPKNNIQTKISFTSVFHSCTKNGFLSPATYFARLVKACMGQSMDESARISNVCRGLLSFPSFIREYDLQTKLENAIRKKGFVVGSSVGPEMDIGHHTDIVITTNDRSYRVWSYQSTSRGLLYAKKKLQGERGEIDEGYHVLCPIDIYCDAVDYYGWRLYSDEAVEKAASLMLSKSEPETYQSFLASIDDKIKVIYEFVKL